MELWRLVRKASGAFEGGVTTMDLSAREDREKIASALRRYAGYNFLVKGEDDYLFIQHWDVAPSVCDSERAANGDASIVRLRFDGVGSPKRSGGQGDILAGVLAVFLLWSQRTDADDRDRSFRRLRRRRRRGVFPRESRLERGVSRVRSRRARARRPRARRLDVHGAFRTRSHPS